MPVILPPKSRKMPLREYAFSKFPGGGCPRTPLGIACQRHARVGLRPTYPPIIARFPPVKNFSYIPGLPYFLFLFSLDVKVVSRQLYFPDDINFPSIKAANSLA